MDTLCVACAIVLHTQYCVALRRPTAWITNEDKGYIHARCWEHFWLLQGVLWNQSHVPILAFRCLSFIWLALVLVNLATRSSFSLVNHAAPSCLLWVHVQVKWPGTGRGILFTWKRRSSHESGFQRRSSYSKWMRRNSLVYEASHCCALFCLHVSDQVSHSYREECVGSCALLLQLMQRWAHASSMHAKRWFESCWRAQFARQSLYCTFTMF